MRSRARAGGRKRGRGVVHTSASEGGERGAGGERAKGGVQPTHPPTQIRKLLLNGNRQFIKRARNLRHTNVSGLRPSAHPGRSHAGADMEGENEGFFACGGAAT